MAFKSQILLLLGLTSVLMWYTEMITAGKISEQLLLKIRSEGAAHAVIEIPSNEESLLDKTLNELVSAPTSKSQAPFLRVLQKQRFSQERLILFWTSNNIFIQNLTTSEVYSFMLELSELNFTLREPLSFVTPGKLSGPIDTSSRQDQGPWGIRQIHVPEVWNTLNNQGYGVTVASIDTGVDGAHPILRSNFRGGIDSWHDPVFGTTSPSDYSGHGTHTLGTILGSEGYGVAPEAQWVACRAIAGDIGRLEENILDCFDWILRMNNKPNVVFLGFTGTQGSESFFKWFLKSAEANKILVVAPAGENGPGCKTLSSPGDNPYVIGVAATDEWNRVLSTSGRGPGSLKIWKPDVSAPGNNTESAYLDNQYTLGTGTSMSAAHVAGVAALIISEMHRVGKHKGNLTSCQIRNLINEHSTINSLHTEDQCRRYNGTFSASTGWGLIDAFKAVKAVKSGPIPSNYCEFNLR